MSGSLSRFNVVEQCISSSNDGHLLRHQHALAHAPSDPVSTRSTLQSFLEFLDQHYHDESVNTAYKEIIRICITEMLANYRSETTSVEEHAWDSSAGVQEISGKSLRPLCESNEFNARRLLAFQHLLSDDAHPFLPQEYVDTFLTGANIPLHQLPPGSQYKVLVVHRCLPCD